MKSVLKVFVLICLIVISKLTKDEAVALQKPFAKARPTNEVFTNTIEHSQIAERPHAPVSTRF